MLKLLAKTWKERARRARIGALGALLAMSMGCTLRSEGSATATDPVCGKVLSKADAQAVVRMNHETYYFDRKDCAELFQAHPGRYCDPNVRMAPGGYED